MLISLYDVNSAETRVPTLILHRMIKPIANGLDDHVMLWCLPTIRSELRPGGAYRDRTDDLLNANQALSQLS